MSDLSKLFYLLEITRRMPQYGYALSGGNERLGNLAEHHYLVTMIAWQLARQAKDAGGNINIERVLEFSLLHDLGELFGGDISMPYAKANPEARKHAKAFEAENSKYLSRFFTGDKKYYEGILLEILDSGSDEAQISKIADYIEITTYKQFIDKFTNKDAELVVEKLQNKVSKINDETTRETTGKFVDDWLSSLSEFETFDTQIKKILGL